MQCEACVVLVTCGSQAEAESIAEHIVRERLAACVNMIAGGSPVRSFYIWEGSLQRDEEWMLLIKTMPPLLESLKKRIQELHSYTVPEFIALPILSGSEEYLGWLRQSVSSAE
ncbi:MAG TPA: divalent-cation tolerance protein CutA [Coleofasciculaceae cyanobacterium]|jgi:periplasmic divalent cation tolerance protein